MKRAIATLQIALDTATNNEPIHRAEGNVEQADLCLEVIKDCQQAIIDLELVSSVDQGIAEGLYGDTEA